MAKTAEEIAEEIAESIEDSDETLDTTQGPIPQLMIRPQSGVIADASEESESLRTLFTLDFDDSITDVERVTALANWGSTPGEGTKSKHIQYFLKFTRPTTDIEIPAGTLVSDSEGQFVYKTLTTGNMLVSSANTYYNASSNAYELSLQVEAVGIGAEYELPPGRINTLLTPIVGIDTTTNRSKPQGGEEAETVEDQNERLKNSLKGVNKGAPGGIASTILNALPSTVSDVNVVQPFEQEFTRIIEGPALDIYNIALSSESIVDTFYPVAGQTEIFLRNVPALSVNSITVNGSSGITYSLVVDTSRDSGYSLRSEDKVVFDIPLLSGDEVVIDYNYNKALSDIYEKAFSDGEDVLFNTDFLVRYPFTVKPVVRGEIKILSSYSTSEVESNLNTFLEEYFTFTNFTDIIYPEIFSSNLRASVSGIQKFTLLEFRRLNGSVSDIEPLIFGRNEISEYDATYINISVQGT